ncbi:MAG: deoxyguanosinetriphosphate triphosphohydrolase [Candidatus Omnitrophica bacterium CG11_big_fil_rev_8_21_14_0_20_42_13]|uniref:Deoxyguanosinetriphosphate triphosphohydrolase-like protein n=1 Tax=Candidatus Ghiorseimicrobium undicola TaxID=1974746 RepID=A0A2H0M001_9BACT|nr:MAG: deoxyguanosinetriphosphate triphosphohydrolase [Candidatus Omnitrophica bacterium CG11_big_fil_rev_8_21_14_0_20_42_13]
MLTRKEIERYEDIYLAPYAAKSRYSRGRKYEEAEHPYRSCYQRDRDRIIHSAAFRSLEYKTQVFVNHEGDYYRTRLTHTLEVAQIARTIAAALRLNESLVEAIALAHDLGHTPFGHAGEEALSELMRNHGGFDHNLHGLRVVDILEKRYPDFKGLNLTWEVREGIVKHSTIFDKRQRVKGMDPDIQPTLETQIVDIADEIAYDNHDLDDGLTSGLLNEKDLKNISLWDETCGNIRKKYQKLDDTQQKYQIIKSLINTQVTDIITESEKKLKRLNLKTIEQVRKLKYKVISFSDRLQVKRSPLRKFLLQNLYRNYRVVRMSYKAKRFIKELFNIYLLKPEQLPDAFRKNNGKGPLRRILCDYIAGMTDRYALNEYKKLFDPYEKV